MATVIGGALLLAAGVAASAAASFFLADKVVMNTLVDGTPTSFDPRMIWGQKGARPLFGVAWMTIYTSSALCAVYLLFLGLFSEVENEETVFSGLVFVASAFLMTGAWTPVFQLGEPQFLWVFIVSTWILGMCAIFALVGVAMLDSFRRGALFALLVGVPTGVFAGWLAVATTISVLFTISAYNNGLNENRTKEPGWAPAIVAAVMGILSVAFVNPALVLPAVAVVFFLKRNLVHTLALSIGAVFWLASCAIVLLN